MNVVGTAALFKASYPLLKSSTPAPKFVVISSGMGSNTFGATLPVNTMPYNVSKAAVNYLTTKLHFEYAQDGLSTLYTSSHLSWIVRRADTAVASRFSDMSRRRCYRYG